MNRQASRRFLSIVVVQGDVVDCRAILVRVRVDCASMTGLAGWLLVKQNHGMVVVVGDESTVVMHGDVGA